MERKRQTHHEKIIRKNHDDVSDHSHNTAYNEHFLPAEYVGENP